MLRDRAELVTDDVKALRERLETVTGERIAALEGIGEMPREAAGKGVEAVHENARTPVSGAALEGAKQRDDAATPSGRGEMPVPQPGKARDMDLGL